MRYIKKVRGAFVLAMAVMALGLTASRQARADEAVYEKAVRSTVLIVVPHGKNNVSYGSGAVVDAARRLVVTANHVPGKAERVVVMFPREDNRGIINSRDYYLRNLGRLAIRARVVARRPQADLALLQLESLPPGVRALPLAHGKGLARPGTEVHIIGNSSINHGGVFGCRRGMVTNVYPVPKDSKLPLRCWVLETQVPTNKGDSGGPLVNSFGELVGVVSQGTTGANSTQVHSPYREKQVTDHSIDAGEVGLLLKLYRQRALGPVLPPGLRPPLPPPGDFPLPPVVPPDLFPPLPPPGNFPLPAGPNLPQ